MKFVRSFFEKSPFDSIRFKLSAGFMVISLIIAGFVIDAVHMELATIERAALLEAEQFAKVVAYTGIDEVLNKPEYLQSYVDGLHALHGRDLVFVNINKKGIADADKRTIGSVYNQDANDEVGQTIRDGKVRTFIEREEPSERKRVKQIVVPLREKQTNRDSAIVGAAIVEYTHIYDELVASEEKELFKLVALGVGCILLSMVFGLRTAARLAQRIKILQDAADIIARGKYETNVPVTSGDEVGKLGMSFNTMADALRIGRHKLVEYGRVLDERVKARTVELTEAVSALGESERRFTDMLGNVELVSLMLDCDARITYANDYLLHLTGWQREEFIGRSWHELIVPAENQNMKDVFAALLANIPAACHNENEILTRSGERRLIRWNNSVLRSGSGDVIGTASIGEDITERKKAEEQITYLNRVYAVLSGINTLIVRVRDRNELFRDACRIAVEAGGFRMAWIGILDRTTIKMVPIASAGGDEELFAALKDRLGSSEGAPTGNTITARVMREKKAVVTNDLQNNPTIVLGMKYSERGIQSLAVLPLIVSDEVVGIFALYAGENEFFHEEEMKLLTELAGDISFATDNIHKQERLDYLAYYDTLTGLANRTLFLERLAQYKRSALSGVHQLALGLLDVERFKNINDSLGRPAGDALLKQVAEWLIRNVGDAGLLARVGADHFALVLPEVKQGGNVARLVEKTLDAFLEHPFCLNDTVFRISAKMGVTLFPDDGGDADTLMKNAEAALKKAKASGERYLFYTQKMTAAVAGKLTLENQLRRALENKEFVLHYQPKVNLASGRLTSAEALIRWNDPRTGLVPPAQFIPILEETGLIYEVGRWALRKAIADYLRWRAAGLPVVRIAVNVSPLQLRNRGFVAEIEQAIGIDANAPAGLELEITESVIMDNIQHNIDRLRAIRAMGVTIAIDDFGTGFSSLSYLAKLPVDTLKVDRSFVIDMTSGPQGMALVSTIINLAHSMKLKVVAEGVETDEQSRLLRLLNCDEMQGYFFSKPVPGETFESKFLALPLAA